MSPTKRPTVTLLPGRHKRVAAGHPWAFSNEIAMDNTAKRVTPGALVQLAAQDGTRLGAATFNPHSLIAARILDPDPAADIGQAWIEERLRRALALRARLFEAPFYRLVHAEADGLPGLVVDRFGAVVVVQLNTAGMEALRAAVLGALDAVVAPEVVVLRNDTAARGQEGVEREVAVVKGAVDKPVEVREGALSLRADPVGGQKTGWFYDQRRNRAFVAGLCRDGRLLDLYAYGGALAVRAAACGANEAVAVDRSEPALELARSAAKANGVESICRFEPGDAFAYLERLAETRERFEVVAADPPAFVKARKDLKAGLRGYRKLARLAAGAVAPGGFLFLASCSHAVDREAFAEAVRRGLADAGRAGRILRDAGAGPDHPVHPHLPESAYLKTLTLQLD